MVRSIATFPVRQAKIVQRAAQRDIGCNLRVRNLWCSIKRTMGKGRKEECQCTKH